jgi:hypothetical protein
MYVAILGAVSFVSSVMAVSSLRDGIVDVAVVAVGADVFDVVNTVFTAAISTFRCTFSRHFFL